MAKRDLVWPGGAFVDVKTGELTSEAIIYLDELANSPSYGLRTVRDDTLGILTGTRTLSKVLTTTTGDIDAAIGAANANSGSAGSNEFSVTSNSASSFVFASGAGSVGTSSVTVSVSGGTASYSIVWSKVSGDDFTINSDATLLADGDFAVTGTTTIAANETKSAVYKATITDSAGSPLTATIQISFSATYIDTGGIGSA